MRRSRTVPVSARCARSVRWAMTALVVFALPATAHARMTDSPTPPVAARAITSAPAPRAAIPLSQLAPGSLAAVAATSATNAWAVGTETGFTAHRKTVILHWNGSAWRVVATPVVDGLSAVAVLSAHNAWAVGGSLAPVAR